MAPTPGDKVVTSRRKLVAASSLLGLARMGDKLKLSPEELKALLGMVPRFGSAFRARRAGLAIADSDLNQRLMPRA